MKIKNFLIQSPMYSIYKANLKIIEHFQNDLRKLNVHFFQALILISLFFEDKKIRPTQLVKIFEVKPSNVSHSIKELEKKGFIRRSRDVKDARLNLVELSPAGRKITMTLIKKFDKIQNDLETSLGTSNFSYFVQEVDTFIEVYKNLTKQE